MMNKRSIESLDATELLELLEELDTLRDRAAQRLAEITAEELLQDWQAARPTRKAARPPLVDCLGP